MKTRHLTAPLLLILALGSARATTQDPKRLMESYVEALIAEDYEKAGSYWHPQYLETCNRLGITYRDVSYKFDCMSPLLQNIEQIRTGAVSWDILMTRIDPEHHKAILKMSTPGGNTSYEYFFQEDSTGAYLVPRFWLHLNGLALVKTKYFDLFYRDKSQLNDFALFDLDNFTERMLVRLGASDELLARLEEQRMEYFLAESDNEVAELTGFRNRSMFFTPSDVIFSRYLPDYHEIALFALSYVQDSLGLYAEPFIETGLACMLGGRFGQAKEVMPQIANLTLGNEIYALEDVLTVTGFHESIGNIDFSYPLSLAIVEVLVERYNIKGALKLLSDLSGSHDEVAGWTSDDVKATITAFTGKSWAELESLAVEAVKSDPFPNLKPEVLSDSGMTVFESGTPQYTIRVTFDGSWYNVNVLPHSPDMEIEGTLAMVGPVGYTYTEYRSFLWEEQFSEIPYISELYSIRYTPFEVGIYDYLTNRLVAKYVSSFDESGALVNDGKMSFRFKKEVFQQRMDSYRCRIVSDEVRGLR